jgi:hypothetical protein
MERNVKAFIVASLIYLFVGGLLGTLLSFNIGQPVLFRYAHLHLLLLGFMVMMVYGVGYFILPRFNGTTMHWPWLITPQFWVGNIGVLGLAFADMRFRGLFAVIALLSMAMFALNMIVTLLSAPSVQQRLNKVDEQLKKSEASPPTSLPMEPTRKSSQGQSPLATATAAHSEIHGDLIIGEVIANYPALETVVRTFFGDGCFSCPGQATETLREAAAVHNIDPDLLISEMRKKLAARED